MESLCKCFLQGFTLSCPWLKPALKKCDFPRSSIQSKTGVGMVGEGRSEVKWGRMGVLGEPGGAIMVAPQEGFSSLPQTWCCHFTPTGLARPSNSVLSRGRSKYCQQGTIRIHKIPKMNTKYEENHHFCFTGGRVGSEHWLRRGLCYQSKPSPVWCWKEPVLCLFMLIPGSIKSEFSNQSDSTNIYFMKWLLCAKYQAEAFT